METQYVPKSELHSSIQDLGSQASFDVLLREKSEAQNLIATLSSGTLITKLDLNHSKSLCLSIQKDHEEALLREKSEAQKLISSLSSGICITNLELNQSKTVHNSLQKDHEKLDKEVKKLKDIIAKTKDHRIGSLLMEDITKLKLECELLGDQKMQNDALKMQIHSLVTENEGFKKKTGARLKLLLNKLEEHSITVPDNEDAVEAQEPVNINDAILVSQIQSLEAQLSEVRSQKHGIETHLFNSKQEIEEFKLLIEKNTGAGTSNMAKWWKTANPVAAQFPSTATTLVSSQENKSLGTLSVGASGSSTNVANESDHRESTVNASSPLSSIPINSNVAILSAGTAKSWWTRPVAVTFNVAIPEQSASSKSSKPFDSMDSVVELQLKDALIEIDGLKAKFSELQMDDKPVHSKDFNEEARQQLKESLLEIEALKSKLSELERNAATTKDSEKSQTRAFEEQLKNSNIEIEVLKKNLADLKILAISAETIKQQLIDSAVVIEGLKVKLSELEANEQKNYSTDVYTQNLQNRVTIQQLNGSLSEIDTLKTKLAEMAIQKHESKDSHDAEFKNNLLKENFKDALVEIDTLKIKVLELESAGTAEHSQQVGIASKLSAITALESQIKHSDEARDNENEKNILLIENEPNLVTELKQTISTLKKELLCKQDDEESKREFIDISVELEKSNLMIAELRSQISQLNIEDESQAHINAGSLAEIEKTRNRVIKLEKELIEIQTVMKENALQHLKDTETIFQIKNNLESQIATNYDLQLKLESESLKLQNSYKECDLLKINASGKQSDSLSAIQNLQKIKDDSAIVTKNLEGCKKEIETLKTQLKYTKERSDALISSLQEQLNQSLIDAAGAERKTRAACEEKAKKDKFELEEKSKKERSEWEIKYKKDKGDGEEKLKKDLIKLTTDLEKLKKESELFKTSKVDELTKCSTRIKQLEAELAASKLESSKQIIDLQGKMGELHKQSLSRQHDEAAENSLRQEILDLSNTLEAMESKHDVIVQELEVSQSAYDRTSKINQQSEENNKRLKAKNDELQHSEQLAKRALAKLEKEREEREGTLSACKAQLDEAFKTLDSYQKDISSSNAISNSKIEAMELLVQSLKASNAEITSKFTAIEKELKIQERKSGQIV